MAPSSPSTAEKVPSTTGSSQTGSGSQEPTPAPSTSPKDTDPTGKPALDTSSLKLNGAEGQQN
jgi:hypothetical protein